MRVTHMEWLTDTYTHTQHTVLSAIVRPHRHTRRESDRTTERWAKTSHNPARWNERAQDKFCCVSFGKLPTHDSRRRHKNYHQPAAAEAETTQHISIIPQEWCHHIPEILFERADIYSWEENNSRLMFGMVRLSKVTNSLLSCAPQNIYDKKRVLLLLFFCVERDCLA